MATQYVNAPGGVIVHLNDGTSKSLEYGDEVPENLADYVDASAWSDGTKRKPDIIEQQNAEASRRAALAENGQVNSSSSPVPSNYSELDEDAAAQLVANLARYPEQQAAVIQHEQLFGGNRQKVLDAAGDYAKQASDSIKSDLPDTQTGNQGEKLLEQDSVVPLPDAEGGIGRNEEALAERVQTAALENNAPKKSSSSRKTPKPSGSDE